MDASLIFIALLVMWLVGLFPHMVRRRTQLADSARVDRLPDSVRVVGPTPQESTGSPRSTEAILPTAAARTAAIEQHLDVKTMESPEATTSNMRSAAARPARPVRRSEQPAASQPSAGPQHTTPAGTSSHAARNRRMRIRRLGIGFLGLAGITLISVVLALLSVIAWGVPVIACALTVVDFLMLRSVHSSAKARSATTRRHATPDAGESAGPAARRDTRATGAKTSSSLAMAASAFEAEPVPAADAATAEHDGDAVEENGARQADRPATSSVSWSPVPVPRPMYLDAPKAERAEPAPLVADASVHDPVSEPADDEKSTETEAERSLKESAARRWVEEPGHRPEVEDARPVTKNKTAAELGRLDDVLQRRRAVGE